MCPLRAESVFLVALLYAWPAILEAYLPGAGPLGWGPQCGAQTPCSLGRTFSIMIIFPFVCHLPKGASLDYTASLPLLPVLLWFLLFFLFFLIFFNLLFIYYVYFWLCWAFVFV